MKSFFFLIILFYSIQLVSQPYLNETSRWEQVFHTGSGIGYFTHDEIIIQLDGDTVIGSITYHRMLKTGIHLFIYDYSQDYDTIVYEPIHEYLDPIREEGNLFIAYNRAEHHEYILYDFSGAVGDTMLSNNCERDTIQYIDTLYLGAEPRKQFHLPAPIHEFSTLVEGVGSTFGYGWRACNNWGSGAYAILKCFSQDGNYMQFYPNYKCSDFVIAVDPVRDVEFSIYPNPFTDEIEIHFANDIQETFSISIVNLVGAVVFEKQFLPQSSIEHISLPDLTAGMYLMCFRSKEGISTQRMIKQ